MTSSDESKAATGDMQAEQATAKILELLDKLAMAEGFGNAAAATGTNEDEIRASLRQAAEIIRKKQDLLPKKRWPLLGSILDWREMTVAEALQVLADYAATQHFPSPPKPPASSGSSENGMP